MAYFDDPEHVDEYIQMVEGYDGSVLIETFRTYVPAGASILELGMGPGKDLDLLSRDYTVTGSDSSRVFVDLYAKDHPGADILLLDAVTISTARTFDCIFSNKVLIHLSTEELIQSFQRQWKVLPPGGTAFHTFWAGDSEEFFKELRFIYYTPEILTDLIHHALPEGTCEIAAAEMYAEDKENDSFYIVLKRV